MQPDLQPIMTRASELVESNPGLLTKSELARRLGGRRQWAWAAIDKLLAEGGITTQRNDRGHSVCVPTAYAGTPPGTAPEHAPEHPEHAFDGQNGNEPGTGVPGPASGQTTTASSGKDGEVRPTATTNGYAPLVQPRCKVCKSPELRHKVNQLLANGFTTSAVLSAIAGINAALPPKARITDDSLNRHRHRHFPTELGVNSIWRQLMERRAEAESATFQDGVTNLLTPRIFFETVMVKGYGSLLDESADVTIDQAARAAAELNKLAGDDDKHQRMAEIMAQQNRIVQVMRDVVPTAYHQAIMNVLDGKELPPPGGPRLRAIEGGAAQDTVTDEFDPLDDELDEYDDED